MIMQNKANFKRARINVSCYLQKDYENESVFSGQENKANQTQFPRDQNERELICKKGYEMTKGKSCIRMHLRCLVKQVAFDWLGLTDDARILRPSSGLRLIQDRYYDRAIIP